MKSLAPRLYREVERRRVVCPEQPQDKSSPQVKYRPWGLRCPMTPQQQDDSLTMEMCHFAIGLMRLADVRTDGCRQGRQDIISENNVRHVNGRMVCDVHLRPGHVKALYSWLNFCLGFHSVNSPSVINMDMHNVGKKRNKRKGKRDYPPGPQRPFGW